MVIEQRDSITILHVDDDSDFTAVAAEFLERENEWFSVQTASDAREALDHLSINTVDCVVSDYEMPVMDGIELLEAVRDGHPELPYILFTGKGSEEVASEAISGGVTDYLQKRTDSSQFELLANRIENAVEQRWAQESVVKTEQRFQTIADHANDIFWIFEADFDDLLFVNSTYEDIWGRSIESLKAQPRSLLEGVHTDDRSRVSNAIDRVTAGESVDLEFRVNPEEDHQRWVWVKGTPVRNDAGEMTTIVGFARDITDRKEREQRLERTTDLFEQAQQIADLGAWETDLRSEEGWWTDQVNEIYGLPSEYEPEPGEGIEYFHPDDRPVIRDAFERAIATGEPYDLELRVTEDEDDGTVTWVRAQAKPQFEDGSVVRVRGTLQDITDSKEREQELERTNALLSTLFETLPQGVVAEDDSRNVLATNDRLFELFGLPGSPEEVVGADCEQLTTRANDLFAESETFASRINEIVSNGEPIDAERLELVDGRTFERSYRPIELPDGDGHLWVYTDSTARREQQRELETILERMNDAVFVHGADGSFMFVNQTAVERYGYAEDELYEMAPQDLNVPDEEVSVSNRIDRVMDEGEHVFETRHRLGSGRTFPVEISATRVVFRGEPAVLSIVRDITDRKEQERELRRQVERLDEFASVVSHDLRNPLNVAQGRIELAREECDSEHLPDAASGVDRSLELIDDMLELARAGEHVSEVESVDVAELAQACWGTVETRDATIVTDIDSSIRADRSRFRQLLENLFRNAVEHGSTSPRSQAHEDAVEHGSTSPHSQTREDAVEHGEGAVTVRVGEVDTGFYVEDDGSGIPEPDRGDVFATGYSTNEDGTGFGLSIVEEIVEAHEWEIHVTAGDDGGTRFEITGVDGAE